MKLLSKLFIFIILLGTSAISMSTVSISSQISDVEPTEEQSNTTEISNPISPTTADTDCSLPHNKKCYPRSNATDSVSISGTIKRVTINRNPKN
ncbi:hypothetical protein [Arsenophonus apicola]|uniref:Secreted protein n=1 Tax=Arsenophonus apicola TaxID=2879119 RepID=A0ABY8P2D8_9GAMM|nr:hypothetical protein [Arsenophonus apicola]WGO83196.1 hypothetical protein QG404_12755 [Arsenophonus apicola]